MQQKHSPSMDICDLSPPPLPHHPTQYKQGPFIWLTRQLMVGRLHSFFLSFILSLYFFSLPLSSVSSRLYPVFASSFRLSPPTLYLSLPPPVSNSSHPASPSLSSCCVVGLQLVLRGMSEALVDRRAAPALITLCSGPELWVNWHKKTFLWTPLFCGLHPYSVSQCVLTLVIIHWSGATVILCWIFCKLC